MLISNAFTWIFSSDSIMATLSVKMTFICYIDMLYNARFRDIYVKWNNVVLES